MPRFLKRLMNGEKGQALAIVLVLLAIGSLTIAVNVSYATTNLKGSQITEKEMTGGYAAGAGVEYTVWSLKKGLSAPTQLTENISGMSASIATVNRGTRTMVLTGWDTLNTHPEYIGIDTNIAWDAGAGAYSSNITLTWQVASGSPKIVIDSIGMRIPAGFSFSSNITPSGMSTSAPTQSGNISTGYIFIWSTADGDWPGGNNRPTLDDPTPHTLTQRFYITGSGSADGGYGWVSTSRQDIGTVGEISGTLYKITSTARRPADSQITAEIVADVMIRSGGAVTILSWQKTK